jgi:hypothetical protein
MAKKIHETKKDITGTNLIEGREYLVYDTDDLEGVDLELDKCTLFILDGEWYADEYRDFELDTMVDSVVFIPVQK